MPTAVPVNVAIVIVKASFNPVMIAKMGVVMGKTKKNTADVAAIDEIMAAAGDDKVSLPKRTLATNTTINTVT